MLGLFVFCGVMLGLLLFLGLDGWIIDLLGAGLEPAKKSQTDTLMAMNQRLLI